MNFSFETEQNNQLIHSLWDINHRMKQIYDEKASQSRILIILLEQGSITQRKLTEHLQIKPGSASEILTKMEHAGLLSRRPNESDHRTSALHLTESGRELARKALKQRQLLHQEMFSCLTSDQKEELLRLLAQLLTDWDKRFLSDQTARQEKL